MQGATPSACRAPHDQLPSGSWSGCSGGAATTASIGSQSELIQIRTIEPFSTGVPASGS
jgi:hypothetical protein